MSEGRKMIESLFDENARIRSNADVIVENYGLRNFREGLERGRSEHAALTARVAELEGLTRELSEMAGRVTGWEKHGATLYLDADFLRRVHDILEQKP